MTRYGLGNNEMPLMQFFSHKLIRNANIQCNDNSSVDLRLMMIMMEGRGRFEVTRCRQILIVIQIGASRLQLLWLEMMVLQVSCCSKNSHNCQLRVAAGGASQGMHLKRKGWHIKTSSLTLSCSVDDKLFIMWPENKRVNLRLCCM